MTDIITKDCINLKPSDDINSYLSFSTLEGVPQIGVKRDVHVLDPDLLQFSLNKLTLNGSLIAKTNIQGLNIGAINNLSGSRIVLREQATAIKTNITCGQLWVKTATPNELWFTSGDGVDHQIAYVKNKLPSNK